ncbi:MAG: glycosyltransferase family 4 protein [Prevotella sp.]|nr:glycosyltransferase family 4 protein [Prevotella sp.]
MRVLIINTSERSGGAALAASRLMDALNNNGVKAKMLVRDKETDSITVVGLGDRLLSQRHFLRERLAILAKLHFSRKHLFDIDIANAGFDITRTREFREADVIHLHWVNQGMLSLAGLRKVLESGKPVVWTMHDAWPSTAICHLTMGCKRYKTKCHKCMYLPGGGGDNDLAAKVWRRKKSIMEHHDIFFVACSRWLEGEARQSALLTGHNVSSIPNPIDTRVFRVKDKCDARKALGLPLDKKLILFVSQRVTNAYKGMDYLVQACRLLVEEHPEMRDNCAVVVLGGHAEEVEGLLPLKAYPLGYVGEERKVVDVYNASDVFVLPSLSENLPNTIMEAMACGVPCVGFKVGGIPEEIDHLKTGYVAEYRNAKSLMDGIHWVLCQADHHSLSTAAVCKVAANFSQDSVALRYIEVYNHAMAFKHYGI